jgi:hypothetical protein
MDCFRIIHLNTTTILYQGSLTFTDLGAQVVSTSYTINVAVPTTAGGTQRTLTDGDVVIDTSLYK